MGRQLAPPQIHQQKRQVVIHICACQRVVEFNRVEERRDIIEQDDVTKVKVAVTLAYTAGDATGIEQRRMIRDCMERAYGEVL